MIASRRTLGALGGVLLLGALGACSSKTDTSSPPPPTSGGPTSSSGTTAPITPPSTTTTPPPHHSSGPPSQGPATEFRPPGDIPDSQVFVDYGVPGSSVHIKVPEGWARSTAGGSTTFTDSFNSISIQVAKQPTPPTVASAMKLDVPQLRKSTSKFGRGTVSTIQRAGGRAVLITYFIDSAQDQVTGKVVRDAVERYLFWSQGQEAILSLTGPKTADNVDPWRIVSDSLHWQ